MTTTPSPRHALPVEPDCAPDWGTPTALGTTSSSTLEVRPPVGGLTTDNPVSPWAVPGELPGADSGDPDRHTAEWAHFGPWILPVRTPTDLPALFSGRVDLTSARVAVKIPRPLDRRRAHRVRDLYDHVVVVAPDAVVVASRTPAEPSGVRVTRVAARDILAIDDSVELLDGYLRIHLAGGTTLGVPYNGSSHGVVAGVRDAIRKLWLAPTVPLGIPSQVDLRDGDLSEDLALTAEYHSFVRADPTMVLLAAHGRRHVRARGGLSRLLARRSDWGRPTYLQAALVCASPAQVAIAHRRAWLSSDRVPVMSLAWTIVPRASGITVNARDHDGWEGVRLLRLDPTDLTLAVPADGAVERAVLDTLRWA